MRLRINQIRKSLKLSQEAFGSRLGVTGAAISRIESGDREPSEPVIRSICREYNVDYAWLKTGAGEMFEEPTIESDMSLIDDVMSGDDEFAKSFFRAFARYDAGEWKKLRATLQAVLDEATENENKKNKPR